MENASILDVHVKQAYQHRLALDGRSLQYVSIVGTKQTSIPQSMFEELS